MYIQPYTYLHRKNIYTYIYIYRVSAYIHIHYVTLRYVTLRYVTLHYTTLHYTTLHYITLHYITLHYITLHYIALHCITLHYIALHCITLHCITLHYIALHCIALHCITLHYIALHCITLHYIALHCMHAYIHACINCINPDIPLFACARCFVPARQSAQGHIGHRGTELKGDPSGFVSRACFRVFLAVLGGCLRVQDQESPRNAKATDYLSAAERHRREQIRTDFLNWVDVESNFCHVAVWPLC